jgi:hypothetical protein
MRASARETEVGAAAGGNIHGGAAPQGGLHLNLRVAAIQRTRRYARAVVCEPASNKFYRSTWTLVSSRERE